MKSINQVTLIGRLGQKPEIRTTQGQKFVGVFNLATSDDYTNAQGDKVEVTDWHRVVVWNKQAENCGEYLDKGSLVAVTGKLKNRSWHDAKTGEKRYVTEVVAKNMQFLDTKGARPDRDENLDVPQDYKDAPMPSNGDEEIPY